MTTPQDPEEEPADGLSREDELWAAIVENYGERPQIEELEVEVPPSPRDLPGDDEPSQEDTEDTVGETVPADPDEHFVPPPPPPLPKPPPARLLAWLGLFGVPAIVLVALVLGFSPPSWLGLLLMGWFVGGFVFLVASMKPGSGDGGDDGARI